MAFSYKPPEFTVVERPVAEPSDSPQAAADFLSLVRRRVYDTTAADDNQQVGLTINSLELDKIRFQCGHSTDLLSPSAQALVREAEPYALCPKCLQEEVSEQINWPVFTFIDEPNYFVGDSREATRAQARYFVSMLHLHYDLQREESQQLIRRMNEIETKQFELVLWQALTRIIHE